MRKPAQVAGSVSNGRSLSNRLQRARNDFAKYLGHRIVVATQLNMSKMKGFIVIRSPRKEAERWFELYRTGKRKEAAAQVAAESRRSKVATDAAIDARLKELARSRG